MSRYIAAFVVVASAVSAAVLPNVDTVQVRADNYPEYKCITTESALAVDQLLLWGHEGNYSSVASSIDHHAACVPSKLGLGLVDQLMAFQPSDESRALYNELIARESGLVKRVDDCPTIQGGAVSGIQKYSCSSTSDPGACDLCATSATATLAAACVACAAKHNDESIPCCVLAATVFATFYLHNCVKVF